MASLCFAGLVSPPKTNALARFGMNPFFRPKSYESRLAASISWQEDHERHDEFKRVHSRTKPWRFRQVKAHATVQGGSAAAFRNAPSSNVKMDR